MKRKASTRICIILSLASMALLMPASCGDGGESVFLVKPKVYKGLSRYLVGRVKF